MKIGNWGSKIKFQTNDSRVLTFQNMKHDLSVNTQKHRVLGGGKPRLEFIGPDLESVTFTIELNAVLCHKPKKIEEKILECAGRGDYYPLVVGGKRILNQALITRVSSSYDVVLKRGEIYSLKIDITMTEYN